MGFVVTLKFETRLQQILRRDRIRSDSAELNDPDLEGVMRWPSFDICATQW